MISARPSISLALAAIATLLLAGKVHAGDVSMADGSIHFSTPNTWMPIMDVQGDPEVRVFQVPDPSPTGKNSLARISVTVKQVADISGFNDFRAAAEAKSMNRPGYQAAKVAPALNALAYVAQENGSSFEYNEYYWFKNGHAIQLRCLRPAQTLAGQAWQTDFDKGCEAIAAELK